MAVFDMNNFIIDRVLRGMMLSQADDTVLWSVNQITNPALNCSTETQDAVDMLGTPVATFDRAKTVEFSGENALFDLGLYAAQAGTTKEIATAEKKITAPIFEEIEVTDPSAKITLKFTPLAQIKEIHVLNGDSTLGTRFSNGAEANETSFVHTASSKEITLPTAGKFIMEVLGYDVCDQTTKVHAYLVMENAKLTGDYDLNFTTEGSHPLQIKANQAYCSKDRRLVRLVIPKED